jgi:Fe-S-cluster containining protein
MLLCRPGCGACCTALSISSPIPGMLNGKPAGESCVQLDSDLRCRLFGLAERPRVCGTLQPAEDICGQSRSEALDLIAVMELATTP